MTSVTGAARGGIGRVAGNEHETEPTSADMRAIEAESVLIAAEVAVVDAESAFLRSPGDVTAFRLAKAERALRRVLADRRSAAARAGGFGGAA